MSADNYWYITKHPKGGWSYVMGFMSDESGVVVADTAPSYRTAFDAYTACLSNTSYVEYGVTFSPEARENLGERKEKEEEVNGRR